MYHSDRMPRPSHPISLDTAHRGCGGPTAADRNRIVFVYMDDLDRIVIVTSTQIPHIVRRIVGEGYDL
jgi:hypothetical protein